MMATHGVHLCRKMHCVCALWHDIATQACQNVREPADFRSEFECIEMTFVSFTISQGH